MESNKQLTLGRISLAVSFAAWGLISASAPHFREVVQLTATQTALLVAVPVLLGSLARIPMGVLTDLFGAPPVFTGLMIVTAVPVFLIPKVDRYGMLLALGFWLGLAGASFAVGAPFVMRWFPPEKQGAAVGIYGVGNMGLSGEGFAGAALSRFIAYGSVAGGIIKGLGVDGGVRIKGATA